MSKGGAERDTTAAPYATATVSRRAQELGIDLGQVEPTAPGGRVSLRDLSRHLGSDAKAREAPPLRPVGFATRRASAVGAHLGIDPAGVRGSGPHGMVFSSDIRVGTADHAPRDEAHARPDPMPHLPKVGISPSPASGAEHREPTVASAGPRAHAPAGLSAPRTAAHLAIVQEIDLTEAARSATHGSEQSGSHDHILAFVASAVARTLAVTPLLRARQDDHGGAAAEERSVRLGISLGSADDAVRVLEDADRLSPDELAIAAASSTTTSNPTFIVRGASHGALFETAVLPQGHVAVLTVGAPELKAVVVDTGLTPGFATRLRCHLAFTYDHLLIDSKVAGRFLSDVRRTVESSG